jgi:predicted MPP superfamily phosphohydrolase
MTRRQDQDRVVAQRRAQAPKKTSAQTRTKAAPVPRTAKPGHGLRLVCLSDTHFPPSAIQIPEGDVLIVAGDVCLRGHDYELELFDRFLGQLPHRHKLLVAGNHDWVLADAGREAAQSLVKKRDLSARQWR